jgi:RND family efflux transporter MFP subunit
MKNKFFLWLWICLTFAAWTGCSKDQEAGEPSTEQDSSGAVRLPAGSEAAAGIRIETAEVCRPDVDVKARGVAVFDPRRFVRIVPKVVGTVESVSAFEGDRVERGGKLLSLVSPDFLSAQSECLQIRERRNAASFRTDSGMAVEQRRLLEAAKQKLRFLGMAEQDLEALVEEGRTTGSLVLRSPFAGSVVDCKVTAGSPAEPTTGLVSIADPNAIWVLAQIHEKDLPDVRAGSRAEVRVDAYPDDVFNGRLMAVGDVLDEETRTVQGRVEVFRPAGKLKPGMYADVTFIRPVDAGVLCVPEAAVRSVDGRTVVFVAGADGGYTLREVTAGRSFSGHTEIRSGLKPGEAVVSAGSFTLKSELLKSGMEGE